MAIISVTTPRGGGKNLPARSNIYHNFFYKEFIALLVRKSRVQFLSYFHHLANNSEVSTDANKTLAT
jgi:hypothetical protein